MSVKSTLLGGTDWVDGDILSASDLIDTINEWKTYVMLPIETMTTLSGTTTSATATLFQTINILNQKCTTFNYNITAQSESSSGAKGGSLSIKTIYIDNSSASVTHSITEWSRYEQFIGTVSASGVNYIKTIEIYGASANGSENFNIKNYTPGVGEGDLYKSYLIHTDHYNPLT